MTAVGLRVSTAVDMVFAQHNVITIVRVVAMMVENGGDGKLGEEDIIPLVVVEQ